MSVLLRMGLASRISVTTPEEVISAFLLPVLNSIIKLEAGM